MHASLEEHSAFTVHSCLQVTYGSPSMPLKHLQEAAPFRAKHCALTPHGEGLHGSMISGALVVAIINRLEYENDYNKSHTSFTSAERIPKKSSSTNTNGNMIIYIALCIDSTKTRARI